MSSPDGEGEGAAAPNAALGRTQLLQRVERLPQPSFTVLDGAQWSDFPGALAGAGLSGRSLFLGAGQAVEAAGPWLVPLSQRPNAAHMLLGLVDSKPAAVFWSCGAGEATLWRHLRTLSQIEIPRLASAADRLTEPAGAGDIAPRRGGTEVVFFRHWDPRVIGDMLMLLDEEQFARVFGPADELLFDDPRALGGHGVRRALRSPDLPLAPRGRLRISQAQLEGLDDAARERSRRKIAVYLRQVAPEDASSLSDEQLARHVVQSEAEGRAAGLQSERAQGQWAYLGLTTGGAFGRNGKMLGYVMQGGGVPDTNLDRLFERMTQIAHADELAGSKR